MVGAVPAGSVGRGAEPGNQAGKVPRRALIDPPAKARAPTRLIAPMAIKPSESVIVMSTASRLPMAHASWKPLSNGLHGRLPDRETTDDLGRYRIAALPPGEYMPSVELFQGSFSMSGAFLGSGGNYSRMPRKVRAT